MKRTSVYFTGPRQVELREEVLPALRENQVFVQTICSAISAGTEMLVYRGQFPELEDAHDTISSQVRYPCAYGYACVGRILELGPGVDQALTGRLVFGFQPHSSGFIAQPDSLIMVPDPFPSESCAFLPNLETAVNLVQDGGPILGERVLVLGQGVIGLLVAALLKDFPLESLVTADPYPLRRQASLALGVDQAFNPQTALLEDESDSSVPSLRDIYAQSKFDLVFEVSGSPAALNTAIALTAFSGRIVVGSWYGQKPAELDLSGVFHRSRIQLIASQVSTISPALSGRWDKARRFGVVWEALKRIQPERWITHRFPIEQAAQAYQLLEERPEETIQVLFEYGRPAS